MASTTLAAIAQVRRPCQGTAVGGDSPAGLVILGEPSVIAERQRRPADIVGETMLLRLADLPADIPDRQRIRNRAVEHYLPYATHLARLYINRGESLPDLVQVAAIGLIKAVDRYDPAHGVPFIAFARPTITGELKRHFRDNLPVVHVPRRIQENRLAIRHATPTLTQQLGRLPTVADLAHHLSIGEADATAALLAVDAFRPLSLNTPVAGQDSGAELGDRLGDLDPAITAVDTRETLRLLLAQLPHREQRILVMRFTGMTQSEIATILGLSQMHISRLIAKCLAQFRTDAHITDCH